MRTESDKLGRRSDHRTDWKLAKNLIQQIQSAEMLPIRMSNFVVDRFRGTWIHGAIRNLRFLKQRLMRRSDGERILLERYIRVHGRRPDLTNPRTFSEKLFCRMVALNRRSNPKFTKLADKYAARAYVASRVGDNYLVKLLWHGKDPGEIPFDRLPEECVIKTNHATNQTIVVKRKLDRSEIISKLCVWLKSNYYWSCREYQYFHIEPMVMIEEYLKNLDGSGPLDYRFYCFNGVPQVIQVDNHAHDINPFYDTNWNQLDLYYREGALRPAIARPPNLEHMNVIASQLSEGLDFVRVDLYNIDGKIYFGEFTFTPTAGELRLHPESWDLKLGEQWKMSAVI